MRRRAGRASLAAVALLGALHASPANGESALEAEFQIGLAVPLTGPMAPVGLAMQRALEAAVAETNAAGGIAGRLVALRIEDDGCAASPAEGAARRLAALGVALVIGHPCASAATGALAAYRETDVLAIAVGARHADVTGATLPAPVLRLAGRDDRQGDAAARWLLAEAPARRIAIVHDRTGYARAVTERTRKELEAAGIAEPLVLPIVAGHRSYEETVKAMAAHATEALFFAGYPDEVAVIVAEMDAHGLATVPVLGADALATEAYARMAAAQKRRIEVLLPVEPASRALGGRGGDAEGARARAAYEAWCETARRLGGAPPRGAALAAALRGVPIDTPSLGVLTFDAEGDLETEAFAPATARPGQWVRKE